MSGLEVSQSEGRREERGREEGRQVGLGVGEKEDGGRYEGGYKQQPYIMPIFLLL